MKKTAFMFLSLIGLISGLAQQRAYTQETTSQTPNTQKADMQTPQEKLIAIDVLLEPDRAMIAKADAVNARLRESVPTGYELDSTHAPHITLLQRFVRAKDLDAVTAALTKVFAAERPTELQLKAKGYEYVMWGGVAVTVFRRRAHSRINEPAPEGG